jgi:hypothetical protein
MPLCRYQENHPGKLKGIFSSFSIAPGFVSGAVFTIVPFSIIVYKV